MIEARPSLFVTDDAMPPACRTCSACYPQIRSRQDLSQPGINLSARDQWSGFWNSWLKPLSTVVITSLVCSLYEVSEPVAIGMVAGSFFVALLLCYPLSGDPADIQEKSYDS